MKYDLQQKAWMRYLGSQIILLFFLGAVTFLGYSIFKEKHNQQATNDQIATLESSIAEMENKSLELSQLIKYLRSDEYIEREAREKLNLKMPGEKVVVVGGATDDSHQGDVKNSDKKNWQLWWEYFFGS